MPKLRDDVRPLSRYHSTITNVLMETLGEIVYGFHLRIKPGQPSVLQVPAAAGGRALIAIGGRPRWNEAAVEIVGSGAARVVDAWVTAADNTFGTTVVESITVETDETDYSFALALTDSGRGPPAAPLSRLVGAATWNGTTFTTVAQKTDPELAALAESVAGATFPGEMRMYAGFVLPTGWLWCNGHAYLRTDFPGLYRAIGANFGAPDSSSFNVPNMLSRAPVGADSVVPWFLGSRGTLGSGGSTGGLGVNFIIKA